MKVEPSLWVPMKAAAKLSRTDGSDEKLHFILRGHQILNLKSAKLFDCGNSAWLSDTLTTYQLGDDETVLKGTLRIEAVDHGSVARLKPHMEDGHGVVALLEVKLSLQPALECSSCGEEFREALQVDETLRIQSDPAATQGQTHAHKKGNSAGGDDDPSEEMTNSSSDLLETYVLQKQGIALDAILLDAIECALPDYPRCSQCTESEDI
jgi:hypothetical protein